MLQLQQMSVSYGETLIVRNVDLDVASGEVIGLLGPNGAGKTTLFDVICGFHPPDSGRIILGEDDVTSWSPATRANGARLTCASAAGPAHGPPPRPTLSVSVDWTACSASERSQGASRLFTA